MKYTVILYTAMIGLVSVLPIRASAQNEPDSPCYLRQSDGTVVDLSAWCVQSSPATLSPSGGFDSNFRSLSNQYPPNVQQELNQYAEEHRASAIASAKTTCRVLRYGGARAELTRRRALAAHNSSPSEVAKQQIAYSLAVNQYCPELANR